MKLVLDQNKTLGNKLKLIQKEEYKELLKFTDKESFLKYVDVTKLVKVPDWKSGYSGSSPLIHTVGIVAELVRKQLALAWRPKDTGSNPVDTTVSS